VEKAKLKELKLKIGINHFIIKQLKIIVITPLDCVLTTIKRTK